MPSPVAADGSRRSVRWLWIVGLAVTVALLWWVLRDVDPAEVVGHLRSARLVPLLAGVTLATVTFPLRAIRWRVILAAGAAPPPLGPLWHATAIGFMANNILPARAGELARAFVGGRLAKIPVTQALGSLALERALDGVTIIALMLFPLVTLGSVSTLDPRVLAVLRFMALVFGAALGLAVALAAAPGLTSRAVHRLAAVLLPTRWVPRVVAVANAAISGFAVLRRPRPLAVVLSWTAVLWLTNALSFWVMFAAFGITAPLGSALLVQGFVAIGVALPSAPGYFGIFEWATSEALKLYSLDPALALSYAIAYHLTTFVPITLLGLWSLRHAAHLRLRDL